MERLLVVGCGDVARRAFPALAERYRVTALLRSPDAPLAPGSIAARRGDLDLPGTLASLAGAADRVLHLAPPGESGNRDARTANLVAALDNAEMLPRRVVYISTSGVYGDCGGDLVDETRPVNPQTDRAARRVDAERQLLGWGAARGVEVLVLRVPGIYAANRLPLERLRKGTAALVAAEDVYTNHIHADDLAAICVAALEHGTPGGVYNASDDSVMKMGEYFDLVADSFGLPRPPRVTRAAAAERMSPMLLSFMNESRRLVNVRMKQELGVRLHYPTVREGVAAATQGSLPPVPARA